jgi:endoglucanase Acf2
VVLEGKDIVPTPYWDEPMQKMKSSISIHRLARITVIQELGKYDTTFLRVPQWLVVKENE